MSDLWAGNQAGWAVQWLEFSLPGRVGLEKLRRYRVNVSFLLSGWQCIFGQGCPGILVTGAAEDLACCQAGVHLSDDDDLSNVRYWVGRLTPSDADSMGDVVSGDWLVDTGHDGPGRYRTMVRDGACVLANRFDGPAGKPGCSLHALALRMGVHPSETKPEICWQIPLSVDGEYVEETEQLVITVTATPGHNWGCATTSELGAPGWWCTEAPDAFTGEDYVYVSREVELRKLMGDDGYDTMASLLRDVHVKMPPPGSGRSHRMPGELINDGRPLIPIAVASRKQRWEENGMTSELDRSRKYFRDHDIN
ncbi:hypothetical protein ACWENR_10910 [Micromonospora sp. NPDC004336]